MKQTLDQEEKQREPFLHERLLGLTLTIQARRQNGDSPEDVLTFALASLETLAREEEARWSVGMEALAAEINRIGSLGDFVGGFAPDQWEQIQRAVRDTLIGAYFTEDYADSIVALVRSHLEQQAKQTEVA